MRYGKELQHHRQRQNVTNVLLFIVVSSSSDSGSDLIQLLSPHFYVHSITPPLYCKGAIVGFIIPFYSLICPV